MLFQQQTLESVRSDVALLNICGRDDVDVLASGIVRSRPYTVLAILFGSFLVSLALAFVAAGVLFEYFQPVDRGGARFFVLLILVYLPIRTTIVPVRRLILGRLIASVCRVPSTIQGPSS